MPVVRNGAVSAVSAFVLRVVVVVVQLSNLIDCAVINSDGGAAATSFE